jgi:hypothetical protein
MLVTLGSKKRDTRVKKGGKRVIKERNTLGIKRGMDTRVKKKGSKRVIKERNTLGIKRGTQG